MAIEIGQFLPQPGSRFNPAPRSTRQEFLGYPASHIKTKEQVALEREKMRRQAALDRATMRLSPSQARYKQAAQICEKKLRRLANEYQRLQQRMAECQAKSANLRSRLAALSQGQGPATSSPVYGGFGAQPGVYPVRIPKQKPFGR